ncbi:MAG: VOC family protein [Alphaproteobacteria bacterium]|nr:VOC family protein [Alphaproteobacteria bacterium]
MGRVIHFEIHAADPERAAAFYTRVFGWRLQHVPALDYWLVQTGEGPGIDGGLMRRRGEAPGAGQPVNAFVCSIGVDNLDRTLAEALDGRAEALALPKMAVPGVGWQAYVHDTEGNIIGLHQEDTGAA